MLSPNPIIDSPKPKKNNLNRVSYCNYIKIPQNALSDYKNTILLLLQGQYMSLHLEVVNLGKNKRIIKVRHGNTADRLIFVQDHNDQKNPGFKLREIIVNHDYKGSKIFNNPKLLDGDYTNKELKDLVTVTEDDFKKMTPEEIASLPRDSSIQNIEFVPEEFYKRMYIQLNINQQQVHYTKMPYITEGTAGTGKSCAALSLTGQLLNQLSDTPEDNDPTMIYFFTMERNFLKSMEESIQDIAPHDKRIQCVNYEILYDKACSIGGITPKIKIGRADCLDWLAIKNQTVSQKNKSTQNKSKTHTRNRPQKTYQPPINIWNEKNHAAIYLEFRMMAAFEKYDQYFEFSARKSNFSNEDKKILWDGFQEYLIFLRKNNMIDLELCEIRQEIKCLEKCIVIVDEAQDPSPLQLSMLCELPVKYNHQPQIVCCGDSNQTIYNDLFCKIDLLHNILLPKCEVIHLSISYRCSKNVTNAANIVQYFKRISTGGKSGKLESPFMQAREDREEAGEFYYFESPEKFKEIEKFKNAHLSTQFAVVTTEKNIAQAKKIFNTNLVLTTRQIKGLEYGTIVAFEIFDETWSEINKNIPELTNFENFDPLNSININKPTGQENSAHRTNYHIAYTIFTRAIDTLILINKNYRYCNNIVKTFKNYHTFCQSSNSHSAPLPIATKNDWQKEAKKQKEQGNLDIANDITDTFNIPDQSLKESDSSIHPTRNIRRKKKNINAIPDNKSIPPKNVKILRLPTLDEIIDHPKNINQHLDNIFEVHPDPSQIIFVDTYKNKTCIEHIYQWKNASQIVKHIFKLLMKNPDNIDNLSMEIFFNKAKSKAIPFHSSIQNIPYDQLMELRLFLDPEEGMGIYTLNKILAYHKECYCKLLPIIFSKDTFYFAKLSSIAWGRKLILDVINNTGLNYTSYNDNFLHLLLMKLNSDYISTSMIKLLQNEDSETTGFEIIRKLFLGIEIINDVKIQVAIVNILMHREQTSSDKYYFVYSLLVRILLESNSDLLKLLIQKIPNLIEFIPDTTWTQNVTEDPNHSHFNINPVSLFISNPHYDEYHDRLFNTLFTQYCTLSSYHILQPFNKNQTIFHYLAIKGKISALKKIYHTPANFNNLFLTEILYKPIIIKEKTYIPFINILTSPNGIAFLNHMMNIKIEVTHTFGLKPFDKLYIEAFHDRSVMSYLFFMMLLNPKSLQELELCSLIIKSCTIPDLTISLIACMTDTILLFSNRTDAQYKFYIQKSFDILSHLNMHHNNIFKDAENNTFYKIFECCLMSQLFIKRENPENQNLNSLRATFALFTYNSIDKAFFHTRINQVIKMAYDIILSKNIDFKSIREYISTFTQSDPNIPDRYFSDIEMVLNHEENKFKIETDTKSFRS